MAIQLNGQDFCKFTYGTAWKEEATAECVYRAIKNGFRSIDTANQRKHYFEKGVGDGISKAKENLGIDRKDIFIQSKFTYRQGQDHRLPYDPSASLETQVNQSFESSLEHLGTDYLDSLVLHGPAYSSGLSKEDQEVWRTMEALHGEGRVNHIGVSNMSAEQIQLLCQFAQVKPAIAQIRTFAELGWNLNTRMVCKKNNILFQAFNLITANRQYFENDAVAHAAKEYSKTPSQVIFRFCQQMGFQPMSGTTKEAHMAECFEVDDFSLSSEQLESIERVAL